MPIFPAFRVDTPLTDIIDVTLEHPRSILSMA